MSARDDELRKIIHFITSNVHVDQETAAYDDQLRHLEQDIINFITSGSHIHVQETAKIPLLRSALSRRWILQYTLRMLPIISKHINVLGGASFFDGFSDNGCHALLDFWIRLDLAKLRSRGWLIRGWADEEKMDALVRAVLGEIKNITGNLEDETMSKFMQIRRCRGIRGTHDDDATMCVVCLDALYRKNETIAALKCGHGHEYHFGCIKQWLRRKNTCPICRVEVLETDNKYLFPYLVRVLGEVGT